MINLKVNAFSQNQVFFEKNGDSVVLYLNCEGSLTTNRNASYKRVTYFDKDRIASQGKVTDYYYPKETIAFTTYYENGLYNGSFEYFYKSGNINISGFYKNNTRDSIWNFYYDNNSIEKKIDFRFSLPKLFEFYNKKGEPVFLDGNGMYKGIANEKSSSCENHQIKGELKNGLMNGKWSINFGYSESTEVFENGKFIRGYENNYNRTYDNESLIHPTGFPYFENIAFLNYLVACNKTEFEWQSINKRIYLEKVFLPELEEKINENFNTDEFFYTLLEFQIENDKIIANSFKSITSDNQNTERLKEVILSLNNWDKTENRVAFTIYLPVFWLNGMIYLKPSDIVKFK